MKRDWKNFLFIAGAGVVAVFLAGLGMAYGRSKAKLINAAHNGYDSGVV